MKYYSFLILLVFSIGPSRCDATLKDTTTISNIYDSIRNSFVTNLNYCELEQPNDTLQFIKDALSAFVSFDNTISYNELFFCFEPDYMNMIDPDPRKYPIAQLYLKRDIRWIFLFYLERYFFHQASTKVDKYCRISLIQVKTNKEIDMYGADASENLIRIYRKLIRMVHKKSYAKQYRMNVNRNLLELIGYRFEIKKTSAYEYPSY